jgi:long-subunit acyl-CoA synthetase (AMP-forming)
VNNARTSGLTITGAFLSQVERRGDAPAILDEHLDVALTWREYGTAARHAAAGLRSASLRPGETVGLLLTNRPEFHIADIAVLLAGATPFSVYPTSAPGQLAEILNGAGCRIVVTEPQFRGRLNAALNRGPSPVQQIIEVGSKSWTALLSTEIPGINPVFTPEPCMSVSSPSDIATLIYTAGATGAPKGVELTHHAILTSTTQLADHIGARRHMRSVSYLPMAHIAERVASHYLPIIVGSTVVCCPQGTQLLPLLAKVQPQMFFSPTRLWEKLRAATAPYVAAGADPRVIRRKLGFGRIEVALTGAALCPSSVVEYFHSIGVPLREIYGMSETGVVSIADVEDIGCVGKPLPTNQVRIQDDGELLVRGPSVMTRYRNHPEATAAAVDADGWLHTGDLAHIDADGKIWIVDRKKELIINSSGKNMSPANIEAWLRDSGPLIMHACVVGDGRPYNAALIVIDPDLAAEYPDCEHLMAAVQAHIDHANARLAQVEQIKRFALVTDDWLPGSDELTPTMVLRRRSIETKYAAHIARLYSRGPIETVTT